jgi:hexosaminidase
VREIVDQVMTMHPNSKWLHIGCDEVYHIGLNSHLFISFNHNIFVSQLGYCEKCRFKDRDTLFLSQGLQKIQLILYLFH